MAKDPGQKDLGKFQNLKEGHMPVAVSLSGQDEAREMDRSQSMLNNSGFILKH